MAHILVIDPETPIRALTSRSLIMQRHDVIDVGSGIDARAALASRIFDLVIMDADLPDLDPYDLIVDLVSDRGTATPVILLAADDDPAQRMRAARAGVTELLVKPVGFGQLTGTVRTILERDALESQDMRSRRSDAADLYQTTIDLTNQARERT